MKKQNKLFGTLALIMGVMFIGAFALAGCEQPTDPSNPTGKTPLATPANVRVDDAGKTAFVLKWDAVDGADSYTVDIDGELKQVSASTTSYDLKALTADPKVYPVKVRAVASNGDAAHSDSAYSTALNVEPAEYVFTYEDESAPSLSIVRAAAGGKKITGLTGYGKGLDSIVVPPRIGSIDVVTIGDDAFKDNAQISSISLPQTIITIGAGAFSGTNIASIVIPESVLSIGNGAFSNIIVLVVVVFVSPEPPALGDDVFDGSDAIEKIVVPEGKGDSYTDMIEDKAPGIADKVDDKPQTPFTITVNAGNNGTITTTPTGSAYAGTTVRINVSPNQGYTLENLSVTSADGKTVAFNSPNQSGAGSTGGGYSFTMPDSNVTVAATFSTGSVTPQPITYTISTSVSGGSTGTIAGTISTNPQGSATAGTTVTVNVSPASGYALASLLSVTDANGEAVNVEAADSAGTVWRFTMPASNVTISATFSGSSPQPTTYAITVYPIDGATITTSPSGSAAAGTTVNVYVRLDPGYTLEEIQIDDGELKIEHQTGQSTTGVYYYFTMPAKAVYIDAAFASPTGAYEITVNQASNGTVTTNRWSADEGDTVYIYVKPDSGYSLSQLIIGSRAGAAYNYQIGQTSTGAVYYTFTMPAIDVFINATFTRQSGTVPAKTLTIPNFTTTFAGRDVKVGVWSDLSNWEQVAYGEGTISSAILTVSMYDENGEAWNGGGQYWVTLDIYPLPTQNPTGAGGSEFVYYYTNGQPLSSVSSSTVPTYAFTSGSDASIPFSLFKEENGGTQPGMYTITTSVIGGLGGTISTDHDTMAGTTLAPAGEIVKVYANPDQGYYFETMRIAMGEGTNQTLVNYQTAQSSTGGVYYTFTMPASDVSIFAQFYESSTGGSGTGTGGGSAGGGTGTQP